MGRRIYLALRDTLQQTVAAEIAYKCRLSEGRAVG